MMRTLLAVAIAAGFTTGALGVSIYDLPCGEENERCCTQSDKQELDNPEYYSYLDDEVFCINGNSCDLSLPTPKCVKRVNLSCGGRNEKCCTKAITGDADQNNECFFGLYCDTVNNKCVTKAELSCGGPGERCCTPTDVGGREGQPQRCFNPNYCVNGKCQPRSALPCGEDKERCCEFEDYITGEYSNPDYPYYYDNGRCFGRASCFDGKCLKCSANGDTCCGTGDNKYCNGDFNCVNGKCKPCGMVGAACCKDMTAYGDYDFRECRDGLDCLQGTCNYCGYEGAPCCDNSCR